MSLRKGTNLISGKGIDGTNGTNGTNGVDGFSPTATVVKSAGVSTISITDKNGTTTAQILDGDQNLLTNIAPTYSSSSTYAEGDYVTYNYALYVCNTTISTAEEWNSAHWTQTTVTGIVGNIETALTTITTGSGV